MNVQGVHHFALTVADIDRSIAFYSRFGFEVIDNFEIETPAISEGTGVAGRLGIAHLRRDGVLIEFLRYFNEGREHPPANNDIGSPHIAFQVDDIFAWYDHLREEGVTFVSPPQRQERHGVHWVFMKDPDGITVELLQPPEEQ